MRTAATVMIEEMPRRALLLLAVAAVASVGPLTAVGPAAAAPPGAAFAPVGATARVGTPGADSYWAYVARDVKVRARPATRSAVVMRLTTRTQDSTSELVSLLDQTTSANGTLWYRARLPILPNNRTGWIRAVDLDRPHRLTTRLTIDRARFRLTLRRAGKVVMTARVGVGKPGTPTPAGHFYVRDALSGFPKGARELYGPYAFGTSGRSSALTDWPGGGVIGIHGTGHPELLPGRVSHGCVRLANRDILRLRYLLPIGTPLTIR